MKRLLSITLLVFVALTVPLSLSADGRLNQSDMTRAVLASQMLREIRTVAPRDAATLQDLPTWIFAASDRYDIDPLVLFGLVRTESTFHPGAVSPVGAIGLTQFMPSTIRSHGMSVAQFQACLACQIDLAARYLAELKAKYGGRRDLALLAYHGSLQTQQSRYVLRVHGVQP